MNGTNTFVLVSINGDKPHPYMRKRNVCKVYGYLPSEYDNEDCFDMDMLGDIESAIAEKNKSKGADDAGR